MFTTLWPAVAAGNEDLTRYHEFHIWLRINPFGFVRLFSEGTKATAICGVCAWLQQLTLVDPAGAPEAGGHHNLANVPSPVVEAPGVGARLVSASGALTQAHAPGPPFLLLRS